MSKQSNDPVTPGGAPTTGWVVPIGQQPLPTSLMAGLAIGVSGYALGGLAFVFFALTQHADPHDRVGGALGFAILLDFLPTIVMPTMGIVWLRTGRRRRGLGVLIGVIVGIGLTVVAAWAILHIIEDWSHHCPCDPPIELW
jgi:Na+/proline symporter